MTNAVHLTQTGLHTDASLQFDLGGSPPADLYIGMEIYVSTATYGAIFNGSTPNGPSFFYAEDVSTNFVEDFAARSGSESLPPESWEDDWMSGSWPSGQPPLPDTWQTIEVWLPRASDPTNAWFKVDGQAMPLDITGINLAKLLRFGLVNTFQMTGTANDVWINRVKIGSAVRTANLLDFNAATDNYATAFTGHIGTAASASPPAAAPASFGEAAATGSIHIVGDGATSNCALGFRFPDQTVLFAEIEILFSSGTLAMWNTDAKFPWFINLSDSIDYTGERQSITTFDPPSISGVIDDISGTQITHLPLEDVWYTMKVFYRADGSGYIEFAGIQQAFGGSAATFKSAWFGLSSDGREGDIWLNRIKLGTAEGAHDLLNYDPSVSNVLSDSFLGQGPHTLATPPVTAPSGGGGTPPSQPEGVCVAFTDVWNEPNPTWTRIDGPGGFGVVSAWSIDRGRSDELAKSKTGTATIDIVDVNGIFDPTNSFSPILDLGPGASIDPRRQVCINAKHPITDEWITLFRGFIDEIDLTLSVEENVFRGTIACVDLMAILAKIEVVPDNGLPAGSGGSGVRVRGPVDSAGDVFYEDGSVDDRVRAGLADGGINSANTVVFSGNVHVQETVYAVRSTILQIVQDAADAEFPGVSNAYIDKRGRFVFHGRDSRFAPATVASGAGLDENGVPVWNFQEWNAGDHLAWSVDPTYAPIFELVLNRGMVFVINAALATPQNILEADIQGQLAEDSGSILTYGVSSDSWPDLLTKDGIGTGNSANRETALMGGYYVDNMHDPRTRLPTITFRNIVRGHVQETVQWNLLLGIDIGDLMNVLTHHPGGGGFNEPFFVEGVRYTAEPVGGDDYHLITLEVDLSPQAYFNANPFDVGLPRGPISPSIHLVTRTTSTTRLVRRTRTARLR